MTTLEPWEYVLPNPTAYGLPKGVEYHCNDHSDTAIVGVYSRKHKAIRAFVRVCRFYNFKHPKRWGKATLHLSGFSDASPEIAKQMMLSIKLALVIALHMNKGYIRNAHYNSESCGKEQL